MSETPTRTSDPWTSKSAAEKVDSATKAARIRHALADHPHGLTSFEAADVLRVPVQNISSVFIQMERRGQVFRAGTRLAPETGNHRTVWRLQLEEHDDAPVLSSGPDGDETDVAALHRKMTATHVWRCQDCHWSSQDPEEPEAPDTDELDEQPRCPGCGSYRIRLFPRHKVAREG